MYKVIKSAQSIFAMSNSRKYVLDKLYSYSGQINDHAIKCIVYGNSLTTDPEHWLREIATWLDAAARLKCKRRLKYSDYEDNLFAAFGNEKSDAKLELEDFKRRKVSSRQIAQYPEFDITDQLVNDLFSAYQSLKTTCIPLMLEHKNLRVSEWSMLISSMLLD